MHAGSSHLTVPARCTTPAGDLSAEVIAFAVLGAVCGLLGSLFVYCVNKARVARSLIMTTTLRRYGWVAATALLVSTASYITAYTRKSDRDVINDLFASDTNGQDMPSDWTSPSVLVSLAVFFAGKLTVF